MRRTASEILRNLENRVARLESMRRTASQSNPHSSFWGKSEFLPVSTEALQHALKVGSPTDVEAWGFNTEALNGNEIHQVTFDPNRNLCTWEMSVRGELVFNLVGKLYICFKPLVDSNVEVLTYSKTVQMEHYPLFLETYSSLLPYWKKAQSN